MSAAAADRRCGGGSALIKRENSIPGLPTGTSGKQVFWDGREL